MMTTETKIFKQINDFGNKYHFILKENLGWKISWNKARMVYKVLPLELSVGSEGEQTLSEEHRMAITLTRADNAL